MIAGGSRHFVYGREDAVFRVTAIADIHEGNRGIARDLLLSDIQTIADDPCGYWLGNGDYADYVGLGDRRFDPEVFADWVKVKHLGELGIVLGDRVCEYLKPIAHKCLGIGDGNHEKAYARHLQQQGLTERLAQRLGAPYLGYCCFVDLWFHYVPRSKPRLVKTRPLNSKDSLRVRVFQHHGAGYAQTPGGKLNKLIQFMDYFRADMTMVAHTHGKDAHAAPRLRGNDDCTRIREITQIGMITGSYLRTYTEGVAGYAEMKGYRPVPLGAVTAYVKPHSGIIGVPIEGKLRETGLG